MLTLRFMKRKLIAKDNNKHLPAGSVLPKTEEKLLSETKALAAAEGTEAPLKPDQMKN